ncbi:MAG TPA: hypothetical protein VFW53_01770 [Gallionella sp.]|nr:hypothetical protein [Gallionella sp.]
MSLDYVAVCMRHTMQRMQKHLNESWKFIGNYFYYRKRNHCHSVAWRMARDTL